MPALPGSIGSVTLHKSVPLSRAQQTHHNGGSNSTYLNLSITVRAKSERFKASTNEALNKYLLALSKLFSLSAAVAKTVLLWTF